MWAENLICAYITHDSIWIKSLVHDGVKLDLFASMRLPIRKVQL